MTKKSKEIRKVPNLRFPDFSGEWEIKKLDNLCSKIGSGKTPKGGENVYLKEGIPFIRSQNVANNILTLDETHISETTHQSMKGSKVLANDILLNITGASIGRSCVVPNDFKEGNVNQHVAIIRLKNYDSNFLQFILSSSIGQKLIFQGQTGSGREGLNFDSIKKFKVFYPTIQEQKKISSFLTLLDSRIQTQNKIIQHLESLIIGFSQKLFSQQIRFKDDNGNDFSEWEEKKLEYISIKNSSNISANKIEDNFGEYIIYGASGVLKKVDFYEEELDFIGIVKDGAGVGRLFYCEGKSSVLGTMDIIKPKNKINTYFLYRILERINFKKYVIGSTIPHIYYKDYSKEKVKIPCLEEQTKIANFLSSLAAKLEKEKQILEQYKQQKKYLLQNLFI